MVWYLLYLLIQLFYRSLSTVCNALIGFWLSDSEKRSCLASNSNVKFAEEYLIGCIFQYR